MQPVNAGLETASRRGVGMGWPSCAGQLLAYKAHHAPRSLARPQSQEGNLYKVAQSS